MSEAGFSVPAILVRRHDVYWRWCEGLWKFEFSSKLLNLEYVSRSRLFYPEASEHLSVEV